MATANDLLNELRAEGLNVKEYPDWKTRGGTWKRRTPIGVMHHHTAKPVPFPVARLVGDLIKCNMNTKPDGTIWMMAYKACNYSSGPGSSIVLAEVLDGTPPTNDAKPRGLVDNASGNQYFWNFENDHAGDGKPIPEVQLNAIVEATQVVNRHFGLTYRNDISHAEWTRRKIDPRWNGGSRQAITEIRNLVMLGEMMATFRDVPEDHKFFNAIEWFASQGITEGIKKDDPGTPANEGEYGPDRAVTRGQMAVFMKRFYEKLVK